MQKHIRTLENRLEGACHRHNARRAETRALRGVVDSLRRERLALDEALRKLQRGLAGQRRCLAALLHEARQPLAHGLACCNHIGASMVHLPRCAGTVSCKGMPIECSVKCVALQAHAAGAGRERAQAEAGGLKASADREQANAEAEWRQLTQLLEHARRQRVRPAVEPACAPWKRAWAGLCE